MTDRTHWFISPDGWPFLLVTVAAGVAAGYWGQSALAAVLVLLAGVLVMLFHDPSRQVPARPRDVLSPVDGRVTAVEELDAGPLQGRRAWHVCIRVDNLGAYAARSPIEGRVRELTARDLSEPAQTGGVRRGLWVCDDAGNDVLLVLRALPLLGRPRATVRYGERVGQGQRIAWLRIARDAHLYFGDRARPAVKVGDRVYAASTTLARFTGQDQARRAPSGAQGRSATQ